MILRNKGYSMVEWSLVIGVVIGILVVGQHLIKNSLQNKALLTAHYILWSSLNETMDDDNIEDYDGTRTKSISNETKRTVQLEKHSGEIKNVLDPAASKRTAKNVSVGVSGEMVGEGIASGVDMEEFFLDQVPVDYGVFP